MEVYKFGGASVKNANGVRNILNTIEKLGKNELLIVISAMGKMTNAFERIVDSYFSNKEDLPERINFVMDFHKEIIDDLFGDKKQVVNNEINYLFDELKNFLLNNNSTDYNYVYDQIVSKAELISTKICSAYLLDNNLENNWVDVRKCIKSNSDFRRAKVDWFKTCELINRYIDKSSITITQGFIASDNYGKTTSLGREGSDYTAGIFAFCLQAKEVTIFKDVAGVLNADPKEFNDTISLILSSIIK
jgi:aspartate kinase